jgi:alpha-galactosidase
MKKIRSYILATLFLTSLAISVSAQKAQTPPMGWMSWNLFEGNISEQSVKEITDALISSGMYDAGYEYVIIDDLWQGGRGADGKLFPDPEKFPNGMKALADYVHSKGLKLGIYTDVAEFTCAGKVGSLDYEEVDAKTFADWGMDYVKVDYCGAPKDLQTAIKRYTKMAKAIEISGREMVFAICEWGQRSPWLWGAEAGGQLWRTTWDLRDTWEHGDFYAGKAGIMEVLDRQADLSKYAGPGQWNDPDMLMVGLYGKGSSSSANGAAGCTDREYQSQMSLWSLLSAPLLACNDIRTMNAETKRIFTNKEVISINQDALGKQAKRLFKKGTIEIWGKQLADGDWAVGLLNRDDAKEQTISIDLNMLKIEGGVEIRDLWEHKSLGDFEGTYSAEVASHEVKLIRISSTQ